MFYLRFKVGVPVILLQNIDPENSLYNGTCIMIIYIMFNILESKILSEDFTNKKQFIFCIKFNIFLEDFLYIVIRLQFPVCLYFNIIVNKLQRQFFDMIIIDLQF